MGKVFNQIRRNYTIVSNEFINDKSLSIQARMIFIYMLSKPEDWDFNVSNMVSDLGMSKDTCRKYLGELIDAKWVIKGEQENVDGAFGSVEYILVDASDTGTNFTDTEIYRHGKIRHNIISSNITKEVEEETKEKKTIKRKVEVEDSPTWRDDYGEYRNIVAQAVETLNTDADFKKKYEGWFENIDYEKTISKTADWWMSETGWEYRKKKRGIGIDMVATIKRNVDRNRVYKPYGGAQATKAVMMDELIRKANEARGGL